MTVPGSSPPIAPGPSPPSTELGSSSSSLQRAVESSVVRGLALSRALVFIPVIVLSLTAGGAFVYATVVAVESARKIVAHPFPVADKIGLFLLVIDLFLIGATMLIAAIGFYELFLVSEPAGRGPHIPQWLMISDLNDLKSRVIAMIVLVVAVAFAESAVDQNSGVRMLEMGAGVALFIAALTAFLWLGGDREQRREQRQQRVSESSDQPLPPESTIDDAHR